MKLTGLAFGKDVCGSIERLFEDGLAQFGTVGLFAHCEGMRG